MLESLRERKDVEDFCRENDISSLGVFGSVARGENRQDSDIDLLVKFSKGKSLLKLVRMENELSHLLGQKVDLLTENALSPFLRNHVLADLQLVYKERVSV
jgi:hypothetical protein